MLMLMEVADEARAARSKRVLVFSVQRHPNGDVSARCKSESSDNTYATRLHFTSRGSIRSFDCECYDSKNGACKHVLATLRHCMKSASKEYKSLNSLLDVL